jgi:hypothetical protein
MEWYVLQYHIPAGLPAYKVSCGPGIYAPALCPEVPFLPIIITGCVRSAFDLTGIFSLKGV